MVLAIAGTIYILMPKRSVSTDNAYLQADSAIISPKVRGLVARVLVEHNQDVRRGDVLVEIDPEEFDARIAGAEADLESAQANVQSARAALVSLSAEEQLAASNVHSAQVSIRSAEAQRDRFVSSRDRLALPEEPGAQDSDFEVQWAATQRRAARADALEASTSWRITAPFRRAAIFGRRIRALVGRGR